MRMVDKRPEKRPSAKEIYQMKIIQNVVLEG
jgi:hypothetical protein